MGRPKNKKPSHSSGCYRFTKTIGKNFDGTPVRKVFYSSKSVADAKRKAEEFMTSRAVNEALGETIDRLSPFDKVAEKWLLSVNKSISDKTYETYEIVLKKHLIPYFNKAMISDIKPVDIQNYFDKHESALETMKKTRTVLNSLFEFAVKNRYCSQNPCKGVRLNTTIEPKEKRVYSKRDAYLILRYARKHPQTGLAIELMLGYGLRKGEVLALSTDRDIDFSNCTLTVNNSVGDVKDKTTKKLCVKLLPPKNKSSNRIIPLSKFTLNRISQRNSELIFPNSKGHLYSPHNWTVRNYMRFMTEMQEYYKKYRYDIPILNPHELRHTRATIWVNEGKNLFAVAAILGHSDLQMLQKRYAHKDVESIRKLLKI